MVHLRICMACIWDGETLLQRFGSSEARAEKASGERCCKAWKERVFWMVHLFGWRWEMGPLGFERWEGKRDVGADVRMAMASVWLFSDAGNEGWTQGL